MIPGISRLPRSRFTVLVNDTPNVCFPSRLRGANFAHDPLELLMARVQFCLDFRRIASFTPLKDFDILAQDFQGVLPYVLHGSLHFLRVQLKVISDPLAVPTLDHEIEYRIDRYPCAFDFRPAASIVDEFI